MTSECRRGHPYDERNTYVDPKGRKRCRRCNRERMRILRAKRAREWVRLRRAEARLGGARGGLRQLQTDQAVEAVETAREMLHEVANGVLALQAAVDELEEVADDAPETGS